MNFCYLSGKLNDLTLMEFLVFDSKTLNKMQFKDIVINPMAQSQGCKGMQHYFPTKLQ